MKDTWHKMLNVWKKSVWTRYSRWSREQRVHMPTHGFGCTCLNIFESREISEKRAIFVLISSQLLFRLTVCSRRMTFNDIKFNSEKKKASYLSTFSIPSITLVKVRNCSFTIFIITAKEIFYLQRWLSFRYLEVSYTSKWNMWFYVFIST